MTFDKNEYVFEFAGDSEQTHVYMSDETWNLMQKMQVCSPAYESLANDYSDSLESQLAASHQIQRLDMQLRAKIKEIDQRLGAKWTQGFVDGMSKQRNAMKMGFWASSFWQRIKWAITGRLGVEGQDERSIIQQAHNAAFCEMVKRANKETFSERMKRGG